MTEKEKDLIPFRGLELTSSHKNTKITTVEQPSTKKTTPHEKTYSVSKDKLQQGSRRGTFVV